MSQKSVTEFKHVRCVSTAGNIHWTIVKNTYPKETKVKSTHSVFAFMLNGCEPFTIHHINLRYIIYKAAMLIHSHNSKYCLKNTTRTYLNVNDITECWRFYTPKLKSTYLLSFKLSAACLMSDEQPLNWVFQSMWQKKKNPFVAFCCL